PRYIRGFGPRPNRCPESLVCPGLALLGRERAAGAERRRGGPTGPTLERLVQGGHVREPEQEGHLARRQAAIAQVADRQLVAGLIEDLAVARAFVLEPAPQRRHAHRELARDQLHARVTAGELREQ